MNRVEADTRPAVGQEINEAQAKLEGAARELGDVWRGYKRFKKDNPGVIVECREQVSDFLERNGMVMPDKIKARAIEKMVIFHYGIELAKKCGRGMKMLPVDVSLAMEEDADMPAYWELQLFEGSVDIMIGALNLFSEGEEEEEVDAIVTQVSSGSTLVDNQTFVGVMCAAFEEYAHAAFDAIKPKGVTEADEDERMFVSEVMGGMGDEDFALMIYHGIDSEYRGLIWKNYFYHRYLPSLEPYEKEMYKEVRAWRRELRKKRNRYKNWAEVRQPTELETDLKELRRGLDVVKAQKPDLELMCCNAIVDYWQGHGVDVDVDQLGRGVEMMMTVVYAMELAEKKNPIIAEKVAERQKEIVLIDDSDERVEKNDFWMGVTMLGDGRMELWFDIAMLMSPQPEITEGTLDVLPRVSKELTNSEFVFLCCHACEEYAHMAFNVYKPGKILKREGRWRRQMEKARKKEPEAERRLVMYHAIPSEYRGAIWKAWFMRTYLPSFKSSWPKTVRLAGEIKREKNWS